MQPNILQYRSEHKPTVFIGMEKTKKVHIMNLQYVDDVTLDLDLILGSVVMRHRQVTKGLFNSSMPKYLLEAAQNMQIEDLYSIDLDSRLSCSTEDASLHIPKNMLVFYLAENGTWMVFGTYDILDLKAPIPVVELYKRYYQVAYPKEVYDFAFKDEKNPMRVYQVEEVDGIEDFFFEPLFKDSDIIDHVFVPIVSDTAQAA